MGCCSSVDDNFSGLYRTYERDMTALGIHEIEARKLYTLFQELDENENGMITLNRLCEYLQIRKTSFIEKIFAAYDQKSQGLLDFRDFFITTVSYMISCSQLVYLFEVGFLHSITSIHGYTNLIQQ